MVMVDLSPELIQFMTSAKIKEDRLNAAKQKVNNIIEDLKVLGQVKFKEKYGNPSKVMAEANFEIYLAKNGVTIEDYKARGKVMAENARKRREARNKK